MIPPDLLREWKYLDSHRSRVVSVYSGNTATIGEGFAGDFYVKFVGISYGLVLTLPRRAVFVYPLWCNCYSREAVSLDFLMFVRDLLALITRRQSILRCVKLLSSTPPSSDTSSSCSANVIMLNRWVDPTTCSSAAARQNLASPVRASLSHGWCFHLSNLRALSATFA